MYKFRIKLPNGEFDPKRYNTASEAVLAACDYIDINWKEGCEAVAKLDNNMASLYVFKDPNTGKMVGIDRIEIEQQVEYRLTLIFNSETDRNTAERILARAYDKREDARDEFRLRKPFSIHTRSHWPK